MIRNKNTSGQTLIEIVVAVGVISIILVSLVSAVTYSLANSQFALNKAQATKYAQEGVEWLRALRLELGWSDFYAMATDGELTYCINDLSSPVAGSCSGTISNTIFLREVVLDGNGITPPNDQDRVGVTVTVQWPQGARTADVILTTYLTKWQ